VPHPLTPRSVRATFGRHGCTQTSPLG
jgi:hypothetical protein